MLDSLDTLIAFVVIMLVVSLLITIAVQMLGAALNLRGWNLAKGLSQTFGVIAPVESRQAAELAGRILRGSMLSDSSFKTCWPSLWRLATAARPDEIFDSIHRLAIGQKTATPEMRRNAQDLLVALGMARGPIEQAFAEIDAGKNVTASLAEALQSVTDADGRAAIDNATARLQSYANAEAARISAAAADIDSAYAKFQYWYEISHERVQQWFTTHTRILTIGCALVFAFWLQLDTVEIFRLVSSNRAVRDQLVAQSGVIGSQAEKVFAASPGVLQRGYAAWLAQNDESVKTALAGLTAEPNETREKLVAHVAAALPAPADAKALLSALNSALDQAATDTLKQKAGDYSAVRADFDKSGFDLFPKDAGGRWGTGWVQGWKDHLAGVLFSVGLLSLGAPFWYNILKSLTSLRSTVAGNMAEEKKQDQPAPGAPRMVALAAAAPVQAPPTMR